MKVIEIETDVYDFLLKNTQEIGESASSILRRLLQIPRAEASVPLAGEGAVGKTCRQSGVVDIDRRLAQCLQSPRLLGSRTITERFLQVLSFAHELHRDDFHKLLSLPGGRTRVYFACTESDIEKSGKSTHPRKIPGSNYFVMTNADTRQKQDILATALRTLGFGREVIEKAEAAIVASD